MANVLEISRTIRAAPLAAIRDQQAVALTRAANAYVKKAQELSAQRIPGSLAQGMQTGRLKRAIKRDKVDADARHPFVRESGSGLSMTVRIYVDTAQTIALNDDAGSSYAIFQEEGTGLWGRKGHTIKPKKKKFMAWEQRGYAYRGLFVQAKLVRWKLGAAKYGARQRRYAREYMQYALQVKGVRPKRYMLGSRRDPKIAADLKREMDAIMRAAMGNMTGLLPGLITPGAGPFYGGA